ncbi:pyrimidine 5'-nucleotidase [Candidatus Pelagibacter sp. HIMB1506]|uniref:pyrimidine 5'-nucleotidase n=1 Tax=Candidatus Pelagibacter sp. HIMB1506 TaxID=3413337 RepID=UPI003F848348
MKNLSHIKNILFDCDGVLYSDLEAVFGQVSRKMTVYISSKLNVDLKKAKELQTNYFHKYNTSLNGLMIHHEIDPKEFLDFVHDIDLSFLEKDTALRYELENINLRKFVFTNGSYNHVKHITKTLGIDDQFEGIFDIVDAEYHPKPEAKAFDLMIEKFKIDPKETLYIEDIAKNLSIGKERGTITAWLINDEEWGKKESNKEYIDYKIENLTLFLKEIRLLKNQ